MGFPRSRNLLDALGFYLYVRLAPLRDQPAGQAEYHIPAAILPATPGLRAWRLLLGRGESQDGGFATSFEINWHPITPFNPTFSSMHIRIISLCWAGLLLLWAIPQAQAQLQDHPLPDAYRQGSLMLSLSNIRMSYNNIRDPRTGAQLAGFRASGGLRAGYFLRDRWMAGLGMGGSSILVAPEGRGYPLYAEAFTRYYVTPLPRLAFFGDMSLSHGFWRGSIPSSFNGIAPRAWSAEARIGVAWHATPWLSLESSYGLGYLIRGNEVYPPGTQRLRPAQASFGVNLHLNRR